MKDLEIGMYVRYNGKIGRYIEPDLGKPYITNNISFNEGANYGKYSFNIIDLIEKNDIILGRDGKIYQVWKIYKNYVFTYTKNKYGQTITLVDYQIDKILTKEQFENNCYKIGE